MVCVCLFAVCCISVSAEETSDFDYRFHYGVVIDDYDEYYEQTYFPSQQSESDGHNFGSNRIHNTDDFFFFDIKIYSSNGDILVKKDKQFDFVLSNVSIGANYNNSTVEPFKAFDEIGVAVYYTDGTIGWIPSNDISYTFETGGRGVGTFKGSFSATKDVSALEVRTQYYPQNRIGLAPNMYSIYIFHNSYRDGGTMPVFSIEVESNESGLLKSIVEFFKDLIEKVKDLGSKIVNGFSNLGSTIGGFFTNMLDSINVLFQDLSQWIYDVWQGIVELPFEIADRIKDLFIPDSETIAEMFTDFKEDLKDKLGACYEVSDIIYNYGLSLTVADKTDTVHLPKVSLESVNIPFEFGGYDIKVVPNGFNTIVEIVKKLISIVCTYLFINGLRKRYEEVMGVVQ